MAVKQACHRYHNVWRDPRRKNAKRPYVAWVKHQGRVLRLGSFADEADAAWAADFARYLLWGLDYARWPQDGTKPKSPPNFMPAENPRVNRQAILRKLFSAKVLDSSTMYRGLSAFNLAVA